MSGIRVGTPAVTTRGLTERDVARVADLIADAIEDFDAHAPAIRAAVAEICARYPLYQ